MVEIEEVQSVLSKVKINKSVGPDSISHKTLIELANYLVAPVSPVSAIINSSLRKGTVPKQWRISTITLFQSIFLLSMLSLTYDPLQSPVQLQHYAAPTIKQEA